MDEPGLVDGMIIIATAIKSATRKRRRPTMGVLINCRPAIGKWSSGYVETILGELYEAEIIEIDLSKRAPAYTPGPKFHRYVGENSASVSTLRPKELDMIERIKARRAR